MPRNKDFKRRVRARMRKTGESYTAARAQLLEKPPPSRGETSPAPAEYPGLAGMSDDAVQARTGRTWEGWVEVLDAIAATEMPHREIARRLREENELSAWWAQTVTVGYERIRGLREIGQRRDGTYEAHKSKTFPVPVGELYRAFSEKRRRERWLPADHTIRTSRREETMRITWGDGTPVDLDFAAKGDSKSRVAIQHRKLPSKAAATEMKAYWAERLRALAELLKGS